MYFLVKHVIPSFDSTDNKDKLDIVSAHMSLEDAQSALYEFALHFFGFENEHEVEFEARDTIYGTLSDDIMEFYNCNCEDDDVLARQEGDDDVSVSVVEFCF